MKHGLALSIFWFDICQFRISKFFVGGFLFPIGYLGLNVLVYSAFYELKLSSFLWFAGEWRDRSFLHVCFRILSNHFGGVGRDVVWCIWFIKIFSLTLGFFTCVGFIKHFRIFLIQYSHQDIGFIKVTFLKWGLAWYLFLQLVFPTSFIIAYVWWWKIGA